MDASWPVLGNPDEDEWLVYNHWHTDVARRVFMPQAHNHAKEALLNLRKEVFTL